MHKKKDPKFGGRLKYLRKKAGLTQTEIANLISVSPGSYQRYEYGFSPSRKNLNKTIEFYRCSKIWLLHGKGEPYPEDGHRYSFISGKTGVGSKRLTDPDEDPETIELLTMTIEIIKSNTSYAYSLAANIRSFHHAMQTERRLNDFEDRLCKIEEMKERGKILKKDKNVIFVRF